MNQREVFSDIMNTRYTITYLAGYVQNDLKTMIDNESLTKDDIRDSIDEMKMNFDKLIAELQVLKDKCEKVMTEALTD